MRRHGMTLAATESMSLTGGTMFHVRVAGSKAMAAVRSNPIGVRDALREPSAQALHLTLLPPEELLSRRQKHYAQGLMYKAMEDGLHSLSTAEKRELFSRADSLRELHDWVWSTAAE